MRDAARLQIRAKALKFGGKSNSIYYLTLCAYLLVPLRCLASRFNLVWRIPKTSLAGIDW